MQYTKEKQIKLASIAFSFFSELNQLDIINLEQYTSECKHENNIEFCKYINIVRNSIDLKENIEFDDVKIDFISNIHLYEKLSFAIFALQELILSGSKILKTDIRPVVILKMSRFMEYNFKDISKHYNRKITQILES